MDFGFTNDDKELERVRAFRDAAVADGWSIEPTYGNIEPQERAAKLRKDGFIMSIISRTGDGGKWKHTASVHIWGPDGLAVHKTSGNYDWQAIQDGVTTCEVCKMGRVKTERVGFANRACAGCAPALRAKIERPGWCD